MLVTADAVEPGETAMAKHTDTQLIGLSAAARDDGIAVVPAKMKKPTSSFMKHFLDVHETRSRLEGFERPRGKFGFWTAVLDRSPVACLLAVLGSLHPASSKSR
ncbi:MAG: hypothetical protein WCF81_02035 [Roseiarcus sp.]